MNNKLTLKKLNKFYKIEKFKGDYLLFDKKAGSCNRFVFKYLCALEKKDKSMRVKEIGSWTRKLDYLLEQINNQIELYEFDSGYYNPKLIKGLKEEMIVLDYLSSIGFKSNEKQTTDIYGKKKEIRFYFKSLSPYDYKEEVEVNLILNNFQWVGKKVKRDAKLIIDTIDSFIKPLYLSEAAINLIEAQKLKTNNFDGLKYSLNSNLSLEEVNIKEQIIEELKSLLKTLKQ